MNGVINFLELAIPGMVAFVLAAQGTMLGGRAGVFNVSQEGLMALGASVGFLVSYKLGGTFGTNMIGLAVAAAAAAAMGLILAYTTTILRLDQFVVGLALFFAGIGLASLLYRVVIGIVPQPPQIDTLDTIPIPLLSEIPLLGPTLFDQDIVVYFMFLLSGLLYWVLYRTNLGMKMRSVGENPRAADAAGISVTKVRFWATALGAALMGMGGAYLPMHFSGIYTDGIIAGRGWLAIALAFVGGWRPQYVLLGAAFFACMEITALELQSSTVIPVEFIETFPYVAALVVMAFIFRRTQVPAFLGRNYDRESRTAS